MNSCNNCKTLLPKKVLLLFCPECGIKINDIVFGNSPRNKSHIKKVSLKQQIFFTIIPFMVILAAHKIRKTKKSIILYTIVIFPTTLISIALFYYYIYSSYYYSSYIYSSYIYSSYYYSSYYYLGYGILLIGFLIGSLVMLFPIIVWSKHWNKRIQFLKDYNVI
jgi:hypothetical protein